MGRDYSKGLLTAIFSIAVILKYFQIFGFVYIILKDLFVLDIECSLIKLELWHFGIVRIQKLTYTF